MKTSKLCVTDISESVYVLDLNILLNVFCTSREEPLLIYKQQDPSQKFQSAQLQHTI